jgi:hypothetical protein
VTFEGSNFNTVFSNVGHVQLGVSAPAALTADATVFTFDIDKASIAMVVPEPTTLIAIIIAGAALASSRRRTV